jgi:amino acid transporter
VNVRLRPARPANYLLILFQQPSIDHGGMPFAILISIALVGISWCMAYRDIKLSTRATLSIECVTVLLILLIIGAAIASRDHVVDV